jgi:hypothetical protein
MCLHSGSVNGDNVGLIRRHAQENKLQDCTQQQFCCSSSSRENGGCAEINVWSAHIYFVQAKDYMTEPELNNLVRPTLDYLQGICFPSYNFPSSLGNNSDKLVQWCHGAPGIVFLFAEAYKESMPGILCYFTRSLYRRMYIRL